jgi:hypothetical protein
MRRRTADNLLIFSSTRMEEEAEVKVKFIIIQVPNFFEFIPAVAIAISLSHNIFSY